MCESVTQVLYAFTEVVAAENARLRSVVRLFHGFRKRPPRLLVDELNAGGFPRAWQMAFHHSLA